MANIQMIAMPPAGGCVNNSYYLVLLTSYVQIRTGFASEYISS